METKPCTKCKKIKPLDAFHKRTNRKKNPSGRESSCKQCRKDAAQERHKEIRAYLWQYNLRTKYGLTPESWQEMWDARNGRCDICKVEMTIPEKPTRNTDVCVDHNHVTGANRGMLCVRCNRCIGYFEENPLFLERAIDYLSRHAG